jgi:hypothetical protein
MEGRMKSEADFINEAKQYRLVDTDTLAADFKRIYTEGRRCQAEADLKAAESVEPISYLFGEVSLKAVVAAIRAAGPKEGE